MQWVSLPNAEAIVVVDIWDQILFALGAAVLVQHYSIYARHSGIPEIKTVLGGFVIRRFLGAWTLVTKSLGLVSLVGLLVGGHKLMRLSVFGCRVRHVAWEGGTFRPSCLLLRQYHYEAIRIPEWK